MSTLEQLLEGPIHQIYSTSTQPPQYTSQTTQQPQQPQQTPTIFQTAHAAPAQGQRQAAPSQKELVASYNQAINRWVAEPYEQMDGSVPNETYSQEGTWALSVTSQSMTSTRRLETQATIQLNRAKQQEAPIGWELSTTFGTNSGHFVGTIDQDAIGVRCFASIGPVSYQGQQNISFGGDEDSTVHSFGYQPYQTLALGYKYQQFPQATVQAFTASTKVDTVGLGLETTFVQGNIVLTGKMSKKWHFFPTPDLRRGDDATAEMQRIGQNIYKSQITTSASVSNTGDLAVNIGSKIGWKALRDFAVSSKFSLAQGKLDLRGVLTFFLLGRRAKLHFDQDGSFTLSGSCGVWGDSNLDLEGKFEINPIQMYVGGQMPVLSAKLNWNVPLPQDMI
jgi:hypothetical protein